jgi:hypothetical protein
MERAPWRTPKKGAIIPAFAGYSIDLQPVPPLVSTGRQARALIASDSRLAAGLTLDKPSERNDMKQLVAVLVAAMFAATSFAALAQDKSGKMDKTEKSSKMDKKSDKKSSKKKDGKKKSAKSDKMDKMDKK